MGSNESRMRDGTRALPPELHHDIRKEYNVHPTNFAYLIQLAVPIRTRKIILQILDNRVGWSAVKHWCKGTRIAPRWAMNCLATHLEDRHNELRRLTSQIKVSEPRDGRYFAAWRAKRAREIDEANKYSQVK